MADIQQVHSQLKADILKTTIGSIIFYAFLFLVFYLLERFIPALSGRLILWDQLVYYVGLFGSIIGVIYILLIRNPHNYLGYIFGIGMSLCLAMQFFLQGHYDLVLMYFIIFIPIQIKTFFAWRKNLLDSLEGGQSEMHPAFIDFKSLLITLLVCLVIWLGDYALLSFLAHESFLDNMLLKLLSSFMIASSCLANYWLMYQKNDAWFFWVLFCVVGTIFNILIGSYFTSVFFFISTLANVDAMLAWLRITRPEDKGWTKWGK